MWNLVRRLQNKVPRNDLKTKPGHHLFQNGLAWCDSPNTVYCQLQPNCTTHWIGCLPSSSCSKFHFSKFGWRVKWDELVPEPITPKFLQHYTQITMPRAIVKNAFQDFQLHAFCDSSEKAYAAVIYARTTDVFGNMSSHLIISKTVAPVKVVSMPGLELCGAHLATHGQTPPSLASGYRNSLELGPHL